VTNPALKNISASVREKLRNIARQRNADFGLILVKYGLERILFRLSRSTSKVRCLATSYKRVSGAICQPGGIASGLYPSLGHNQHYILKHEYR
jgi:hypothetical protein